MRTRRHLIMGLVALLVGAAAMAFSFWYLLGEPQPSPRETTIEDSSQANANLKADEMYRSGWKTFVTPNTRFQYPATLLPSSEYGVLDSERDSTASIRNMQVMELDKSVVGRELDFLNEYEAQELNPVAASPAREVTYGSNRTFEKRIKYLDRPSEVVQHELVPIEDSGQYLLLIVRGNDTDQFVQEVSRIAESVEFRHCQ